MRNRIPADECARASEWVSLQLDGQLSEFEELLLEAHIERCPDCKAYAANVTGLTTALRATPLEQPTVSFEAPRRTRARAVGLRAVSAAAAVAVVGLSSIVSLQLSASKARPGAAAAERRVIGLKERQMNELNGLPQRVSREIRPSLQAAEAVTVGPQTVRITPHSIPTGLSPR
jgi:ferric-dicitrate binding protein FerR (iron transport regulator)